MNRKIQALTPLVFWFAVQGFRSFGLKLRTPAFWNVVEGFKKIPKAQTLNPKLRLMIYILHYLNDPRLLELWYILYYG